MVGTPLTEPRLTDLGQHRATPEIRNRWLLASRGYSGGRVPHDLEFACGTTEGRYVVRMAINSLLVELGRSDLPLDAATTNLLGIEGLRLAPIERNCLKDIAYTFFDLLDGQITSTAHSTEIMPTT